ncbi:hypothetical protein VRRI112168_11330 [Vreelandella rituensis]|uniref:hypothetical protein n=1 Tax=Vreelandella rituensis TaxID=2282306 RepID=UPI001F34EF86|nr:hypothetical protein [Halomonas rituensis]
MLFADSMSLLWVSYYALSMLVLVAVYFALALLPRLARLVLTWSIAGAMWMPTRFRLPLIEEGEFYTGLAPAAMVSAVGFLEGAGASLLNGLLWLIVGMSIGALLGVFLWWWRRPVSYVDIPDTAEKSQGRSASSRESDSSSRREPVVG